MVVKQEAIPGTAPKGPEGLSLSRWKSLRWFAIGLICVGTVTIEESPWGPQIISKALGPSNAPTAGEVTTPIVTATPLPQPTLTPPPPSPTPTKTPAPTNTPTPEPTPTTTPTETSQPTATATATVPAKPTLTKEQQINEVVQRLPIQFPNKDDQDLVTSAIIQAFKLAPLDATADQVNAAMGIKGGEDFRTYFNRLWRDKYGVDFDRLITEYAAIMDPSVFPYGIYEYIGPTKTPSCTMTCFASRGKDKQRIEAHQRDIAYRRDLTSLFYKELIGAHMLNDIWYYRKFWRIGSSNDMAHIIEMASYALKINFMIRNNINPDMIDGEREAGWKGGYVFH